MRKHQIFLTMAMAAILLFTIVTAGAQPTDPYPIGNIIINATQVAAGIGFTWGGGTLMFKGKSYEFSVNGLDVAAVGIAKVEATGEAYNLKDPSDLNGTYIAANVGAALIKGKLGLTMRNDKGVVINLRSEQTGVQLSLGTNGLTINLK